MVHSYPTNRTNDHVWESFWCSRPCESQIVRPESPEELQAIVKGFKKIRAVGAGHSTSDLQCSDDVIVTTDGFCYLGGIDEKGVATLGAGCSVLQAQEMLLPRQLKGFGSITTQRLGGAISTSLHGMHTTAFADHVMGLTAMLANGTVFEANTTVDVEPWLGSMGMLGIVMEVKLQTWDAEFVECFQERGDFMPFLMDPDVQGFEAFGVDENDFTITICNVSSSSPSANVTLENKDDYFVGFFVDNILLDWAFYLGGLVPRIPGIDNLIMLSATLDTDNDPVLTVNKYRKPVSFHPHFDEEYAVPSPLCKDAMREVTSCVDEDLAVHFYIRRIVATRGWLTWAKEDSCAIRMEFFRFTSDGVEVETTVRRCVEETVVQRFNGSGHFGKPWYSSPHLLLQNSPYKDEFERYKNELDPTGVFQNDFTRMLFEDSNDTRIVLPKELDERLIVWRFAVSFCIVLSVLVQCFVCCRPKKKKSELVVVVTQPKTSVLELERMQRLKRTR